LREAGGVALMEEDGQHGGGIDDHRGIPRSS
jgi:hypothetical protein